VTINQSHGGSSKQARSVLEGLEADVVTMNQSTDLDILAAAKLIAADWPQKFPHNASPYTSIVAFLVRKGNPQRIHDWPDLVRAGLQVIIPNPKTSGNGRYSYLSAWAYAKNTGGGEVAAREFVAKLFKNVPVLDTGGRGATTTFAQRGIGDVLLTFENEAWLAAKELGEGQFEVVLPETSILAEAPVAIVEKVVDRRGTRAVAQAYLQALFEPAGQEIAARHRLRPRSAEVLAKHAAFFPEIQLYTIEAEFGGWPKAQATHFADGGVFDQIYLK
jgi:sulfate transport system substrate-binding protein